MDPMRVNSRITTQKKKNVSRRPVHAQKHSRPSVRRRWRGRCAHTWLADSLKSHLTPNEGRSTRLSVWPRMRPLTIIIRAMSLQSSTFAARMEYSMFVLHREAVFALACSPRSDRSRVAVSATPPRSPPPLSVVKLIRPHSGEVGSSRVTAPSTYMLNKDPTSHENGIYAKFIQFSTYSNSNLCL